MSRFDDVVPTADELRRYDALDFRAVEHAKFTSIGYFSDGWFVTAGGGRSLGVYKPEATREATAAERDEFIRYDVGMEREREARRAADDAALAPLGLTTVDFYRFRGVWTDEKGRIVVDTRGGGGNRDCYCDEWAKPEERTDESLGEPHAPACVMVMQSKLRKHPLYLFDEDNEGDCNYAEFYFRAPVVEVRP